MTRKCLFMPDIHDQVMNLLARVYAMHNAGDGSLLLMDLVERFNFPVTDDERVQLSARNIVNFKRTSTSGGTFENDGTIESFKHDMITVTVPTTISGTYLSFPTSLTLVFSDKNTISGGALFFKAEVQEVDANQYKVDLDLSDGAFDQCIIHAAAA
jgi:hypothetical protein